MLRVQFSDRVAGLTKLSKTQRHTGLLCALVKVMNYSVETDSLLMKLPYYVLWICYIMCVKFYYWNYSGD